MDTVNSAEYYLAREKRERELAAAASNPAIASIHRDMAERYAQLVQSADGAIRPRDNLQIKIDQSIG